MDKLFISLCEKYHKKIIKYLYYSVGNIEDAKDLTQEVFVIVYNRIDDLQNHDNIGGFIYQTAKYVAANFKRKTFKKTSIETSITIVTVTDTVYKDTYTTQAGTQYTLLEEDGGIIATVTMNNIDYALIFNGVSDDEMHKIIDSVDLSTYKK